MIGQERYSRELVFVHCYTTHTTQHINTRSQYIHYNTQYITIHTNITTHH